MLLNITNIPHLNQIDRLTLYHDGSMTKFLELLYDSPIQVKLLKEEPFTTQQLLSPFQGDIYRETILFNQHKQLVFAKSIWTKKNYELIMSHDKSQPIGKNLAKLKIPQYRELLKVCQGNPSEMPTTQETINGRAYIVHCDSGPLFYCEEYFL